MKAVAVSDVFISDVDYLKAFGKYADIELIGIPFFGTENRCEMRDVIHTLERGGSEVLAPPAELYEYIVDAQILMVHQCPVPRSLLEKGKKLKYVLSNRGGTENINIEAATELGIKVLCNPAHNANAVAEYTVALMLAESRNLCRSDRSMRNGVWREQYPNSNHIFEMRNSTIGLIGFGTIARLVARKLYMFDVDILVYDPFVHNTDEDLMAYHCKKVPLDVLLKTSDYISLHARSNQIQPLLDKEQLDLLKPTAYLINTARPHLINNEYLYEILKTNKIAGAALDVFMSEPVRKDESILMLDNVTLTNHRGGDTVNSYSDSPSMVLKEMKKDIAGQKAKFFCNREAFS